MTTIWKCGADRCNWHGTHGQKKRITSTQWSGAYRLVCPDCGGELFFWVSNGKSKAKP